MNFHQPPHTYVEKVDLKVMNLDRSINFYENVIGLKVLQKEGNVVHLTANGVDPLVTLYQPENVIPKVGRTTGLYHFALLLPNRDALANVVYHLAVNNIPFGSSDHLVSEALYLSDPDGNGIEIYRDRPPSEWIWRGNEVEMAVDPLNIRELLELHDNKPWTGLPAETIMGHIHLHVSELKETENFYTNGLGFEVVCRYGSQALFISTGKYHHHIGLNTWNGVGAPKPAETSVGLHTFKLVYPSDEARKEAIESIQKLGATIIEKDSYVLTKDPSGNSIEMHVHQ